MKDLKKTKYTNNRDSECTLILFEDGSAVITGSENFIIENCNDPIKRADAILADLGYKKSNSDI